MEASDLLRRCNAFALRQGLTLGDKLGDGIQGIVFSAKSQVESGRLAIKTHKQEPDYLRERDAYLRLQSQGITTIRGCNVPELIAYDDEMWTIVMTVVDRPFILDFGGRTSINRLISRRTCSRTGKQKSRSNLARTGRKCERS